MCKTSIHIRMMRECFTSGLKGIQYNLYADIHYDY